jgi:malate dehydrogenase
MKVSIIGAGRVGSAAAFSIMHLASVNEIALVDIAGNLAKGEALDLTHAANALDRDVVISGGSDYDIAQISDLSVIIAGKPRVPGMTRDQLAGENAAIVKSIIPKLDTDKIMVVTNPMDVMTWVAYTESHKPREKVFGMGGVLDTARYHSLGGEGLVLGEHGDSKVMQDQSLAQKLIDINNDVIALKKGTVYGPAASISVMAQAIIEDTHSVLPCSCVLEGEYGLEGLAIGVPAEVSSNGVKVVEYPLQGEQERDFRMSADVIKKMVAALP